MQLTRRVRGILVTVRNTLLLIRRVRPGRDPYWVFPGGGVEETDASLEAALEREVLEELAASIKIRSLVYVQERDSEETTTRESFFLCDVTDYDFDRKTGPEFNEPGRGEYALVEVSLADDELANLNIQPAELKDLLLDNRSRLFSMPDLRGTS